MQLQALGVLLEVLLLLVGTLGQLDVVLTRRPPPASSHTNVSFQFDVLDGKGRHPCATLPCSIRCRLDQLASEDCSSRAGVSYSNLRDARHTFEVSVNTSTGLRASAHYSWIVDTIAPTAAIVPSQTFTNGFHVAVRFVFSEPCIAPNGLQFSCASESSCPLVVRGPGALLPSSFKVIRDNVEYSLSVSLSNSTAKGRILLVMAKALCSDAAGNVFVRSSNSVVIVRFDRGAVFVNLWTPVADSLLLVNNVARTVETTNRVEDLKIYLDFTEPVLNTTQQLSALLRPNLGVLEPTRRKSRGNRRFAFLLTNISTTSAVITVELQSSLVISRAGSRVQPVAPASFLFDQVRPQALVSTLWTSPAKTRNRLFPVLIQFSEPVFQFTSAAVSTEGGRVSSFKELSEATYFLEVAITREDDVVSVFVPENATTDVAGNTNLASNLLRVRHYTVPPISGALYSLISAGLLATAVFSAALSISCASLAAAGALTSSTVSAIVTDPSRNLLGMVGHLQVFALSERLTVRSVPLEYSESVRGLRWLIPHVKVPWEKDRPVSDAFDIDSQPPPSLVETRWRRLDAAMPLHGRKLGSNSSTFGPPLRAAEYQSYFEKPQATSSLQDLLRRKYTGWHDFERNVFWLAVAGLALTLVHLATLTFLRWRTKTSVRGALTVPRFELFLALLSLPCITQACAFVISGGSVAGIVVGVILLGLPAAFMLCVSLFLAAGVGNAAFVQYQEVSLVGRKQVSCHEAVLASVVGKRTFGRWVRKAGLSSTFLPRYGLLFEDRKGPPKVVVVDAEQEATAWVDSGSNGIGRMKGINWEGEQAEHAAKWSRRWSVGAARTAYIVVDMLRRAALGILFGAYPAAIGGGTSQVLSALLITASQLLYLMLLKPLIRRGVHAVEAVSLACEAGVFATALALSWHRYGKASAFVMLAFLLVTFIAQLVNEWYALMGLLLRLPSAEQPSLSLGLKMLLRGLLLPFVPRAKWSKFVTPHANRQPATGLAPVVHFTSPSPDFQQARSIRPDQAGVGVPAPDPQLPRSPAGGNKKQTWNEWVRSLSLSSSARPQEETLKVLRELARASFPGGDEERGKQKIGCGSSAEETTSSSSSGGAVAQER
ncbi:uncharacterized protein LOC9652023 isoform X1 [Selaginella moellendorffii]|uniref:uncharacterized protein LOC9652023 isoform X1 n=1 Tax=Selaginella moellendorffii TaxID=88036 RepID=UPI000D1CC074|nr:uncharacterized protein LOC9652023 isoform X1 [Selaginella moellendorffii]|eukprot:XP_002966003.2 uncharacterized protein LOC9652023 isoform X1 [Selaginella moellendorffii]